MEDQTLSKRERKKINKEEKKSLEQKQNNVNFLKNVGLGILFLLLLFGAWRIFGNSRSGEPERTTDTPQSEEIVISEEDHIKGNPEAEVILIEYADFQCPACAAYHPITTTLAEEFGEDIAIIFRHMPLTTIHRNAEPASFAAEAAGRQGKFWEMAALLYENQDEWSDERNPSGTFESYARELQLDIDTFIEDSNSPEVKEQVRSDRQEALAARVNATPTFFLNGEKLDNPRGLEPFREIIQQAIGEAHADNEAEVQSDSSEEELQEATESESAQ